MTYAPPEGELWTETMVEVALLTAWREVPRTPPAALFITDAMTLLVDCPDERHALHLRSYAVARTIDLPERLKACGISRSTYEDRWRRGVALLTRKLNADLDSPAFPVPAPRRRRTACG